MHLVALQFVLVITGLLGGGGQALRITRNQNPQNPPEEYVEVTEGNTFISYCAVSNYWPRDVYWGKSRNTNIVWLTKGAEVLTSDSRVSVKIFRGNVYIYSMQISDITPEDAGKYTCYVTWHQTRRGYVYLLVRNFPKEQPVCFTHRIANSTYNSDYLWCDTVKGYPGVNVTWTVDGTRDDDILTGSVVDYFDSTERERRRTELRVNSIEWRNHQTKTFVCTVTSSNFPGLKRTCSVNVTAEQVVTTEAYLDGSVPPTGISSPDSAFTGVYNEDTTSESKPDTTVSDATQIPGSSVSDNTLAIALVIPALFVALSTVLICVLKRKRQRTNQRGRKTQRATSPIGPNKARGGEGVVPNPTTKFQNESYQPAGDVKNCVTPYEVELDFNGKSAFYPHLPDESTKRDLKGSSTNHKAVQSERLEECQEDNISYDILNWDQGSSSPVPKIKRNMSGKDGGQEPQNCRPADELEGVDDPFIDGESDEGSVDNPIYEPSGNGQGWSRVKPEPQADESHIYQMIN